MVCRGHRNAGILPYTAVCAKTATDQVSFKMYTLKQVCQFQYSQILKMRF